MCWDLNDRINDPILVRVAFRRLLYPHHNATTVINRFNAFLDIAKGKKYVIPLKWWMRYVCSGDETPYTPLTMRFLSLQDTRAVVRTAVTAH